MNWLPPPPPSVSSTDRKTVDLPMWEGGKGVGEEPNHTTERTILSAQDHEEKKLVK
jgi:hypothetical protein